MRKNLIIVLLIIGVAVSLSVNYAEAISPTLQAFLADLESRIVSLEQFNTYHVVSDLLVIPQIAGDIQGTISCNNNDPIINASWESNGLSNNFRTWKITGDTLEYFVQNSDAHSVTFFIHLTCKG